MAANSTNQIVERVNEIAERVGASEGIEVVEIQLAGAGKNRVLRIFIDKPGGVSHADCEFISNNVGTVLDAEDVIPGDTYTLEVSSPGVERKLIRPRDFDRFTGEKVKVVLKQPVEGQKRWDGVLRGLSEGVVSLEAPNGKLVQFRLDQIDKANLKFEW